MPYTDNNTDGNVQQLVQFESPVVSTTASNTSSSTACLTASPKASPIASPKASPIASPTSSPTASPTVFPVVKKQFGVPLVEHFEFVFNSDTAEYEIDKWFEPDFPEDKTLEKWVDNLVVGSSESSMNTSDTDMSGTSDKNNDEQINSKPQASSSMSEDKLEHSIRSKTRYKRRMSGEQEATNDCTQDRKSIHNKHDQRDQASMTDNQPNLSVQSMPSTSNLQYKDSFLNQNQKPQEKEIITPSTSAVVTQEEQIEKDIGIDLVNQIKVIEAEKKRNIFIAHYKKHKFKEQYADVRKRIVDSLTKETSPEKIRILQDAINNLNQSEKNIDEQITEIERIASLKKERLIQQYKQYISEMLIKKMDSISGVEVPFLRINQHNKTE